MALLLTHPAPLRYGAVHGESGLPNLHPVRHSANVEHVFGDITAA